MSIQQEEITIKEFRSGTTLLFFSNQLQAVPEEQSGAEYTPSILHLNNIGAPVDLNTFDGQNIWSMNDDNIYVPTSALTSYITGYSYSVDFDDVLSPERIDTIRERFQQSIVDNLQGDDGFGNPTATTIPYHTEYVFSKNHEIDDFYVNVKLNRTTSTLDTLNVYNNLINSWPTQEAETGVVFGRLMALQTIKDAEGNNIRIPLRNVPVGIFNPSEDYPTAASVTDNGDRIFLNLKESADPSEYFNIESFNFDTQKLLRSGSQFNSVPEQYKYITKTNDEGEFVIYDVPIGTQVVVFEVDLLKQGLTRDEIALNFFPFPPDDDAILDQIPNFSFKQFPINVVPAWGNIQTGYTELDVVVNLDLRKWTTYFFPPVSSYRQKLEQSVANNAANSLKIEVRNMAKKDYPKTDIKMAIVPDDLDRVFNQQLNWNLEFAQVRNKAEFFKFGMPILKLPANLYDPQGYKTDSDGVPTNQKGVWLSAYQFNMFSDSELGSSRQSGAIYAWGGGDFFFKSHFSLNYSPSVPDTIPSPNVGEGLGTFPYEKPWTIEYPNKYSIPRKPTDERYRYGGDRTPSPDPSKYYLDEPAYNDGDLIGYEVIGGGVKPAGGYGSQNAFGIWFFNRISQAATRNFMYKYESGVAWNEKYANGYEPSNPGYPRFAGASSVLGGEKYQRFESGYGYFMRPAGWPRVARYTWGGDSYWGKDIQSTATGGFLGGDPNSPGPGVSTSHESGDLIALENHINDVYNIDNVNLALVLDNSRIIKNGPLEAYRIVNSNPDNLREPENFVLPSSVIINNGASAARASFFGFQNKGDIPVSFPLLFHANPPLGGIVFAPVLLKYDGWPDIFAGNNNLLEEFYSNQTPATTVLNPGETIIGLRSFFDTIGWTQFKLPGNYNFNPSANKYDTAYYRMFTFFTSPTEYGQPVYKDLVLNANLPGDEDIWYVKTLSEGGNNGTWNYGLNADATNDPSGKKIWRADIQSNSNSYEI